MIGVSARPFSKSFSQHVQQMGRVMRAAPGKEFALWLDHSGNYLRFREDWDDLYDNGVQKLKDEGEKAKKELTDKEVEERRCPKCSSLWPGRADTCPNCGYTKPRLNMVEQVDGALVEFEDMAKGQKFTPAMKQEWWSQILTWGDRKGWQKGACSHRYREKFGVWPRGVTDVRKPLTQEVYGWLMSKQIAWSRGAKKARA
jgi:ribosomal protein L40E